MKPITICFTYFKSLTLENLAASLYSVRQQDFSHVESLIVVDNDTDDKAQDIEDVITSLEFPVPYQFISYKHGNLSRTHSWSTNIAVTAAETPWVFFTRADYLLDSRTLSKFVERIGENQPSNWSNPLTAYRFITSHLYHLHRDITECEKTSWRENGAYVLRHLPGSEERYTEIDSGVWLLQKSAFDAVFGMDERLSAWGHAQTHFQHKLYKQGTIFIRVPEVLFYHPLHGGPRDLGLAHQQIAENGIDLREMWTRHDGVKPYG